MVYDDDISRPVHHVIHSSDRVRRGRTPAPPQAIYDLIADLAVRKPAWGAQRIHEEIRKSRHDVSLEMIHYVLAHLDAAKRPGRR